MPYNTGNSVPSGDPRDLKDNSENFDSAVNGTGTWTDRLGNTHDSVQKKINDLSATFENDLDSLTTQAIAQYAQLTSRGAWTTSTSYAVNDLWEYNGDWYYVPVAYTSGATAQDDIDGGKAFKKDDFANSQYAIRFDSVGSAVTAVTASPTLFGTVSTDSFYSEAECTGYGIEYPDGGSAHYIVTTGETPDGYAIHDCTTHQLKIIPVTLPMNLSQFGAVSGGVTDAYGGVNAAFQYIYQDGIPLVDHGNTYRLSQRVEIDNPGSGIGVYLDFKGVPGKTEFTVNGSENSDGAFYLTKIGTLLDIKMSGFDIVAVSGTGNCGCPLYIESGQGGTSTDYKVVLEDINATTEDIKVAVGSTTYAYWSEGIQTIRVGRPVYNRVKVTNPKVDTTDNLIRYADSSINYSGSFGINVSNCYAPNFYKCSVTQFADGVYSYSTESVEAFNWSDSQCVNVKRGIVLDKDNTIVPGIEPGIFIGGNSHIAYRDVGVYIFGRGAGDVYGILFFNQTDETGVHGADPVDVYIEQGQAIKVHDNDFNWKSNRERKAVYQVTKAATESKPELFVYNNAFKGRFQYGVHCEPAVGTPDVGDNVWSDDMDAHIRANSMSNYAPHLPENNNGVYTPTVSNQVNISTIAPQPVFYSVNGRYVEMAGRIGISPTSNATETSFTLNSPVTAVLTTDSDAAGVILSHAARAFGDVGASGGELKFTFESANAVNSFYYFNVSFRID